MRRRHAPFSLRTPRVRVVYNDLNPVQTAFNTDHNKHVRARSEYVCVPCRPGIGAPMAKRVLFGPVTGRSGSKPFRRVYVPFHEPVRIFVFEAIMTARSRYAEKTEATCEWRHP